MALATPRQPQQAARLLSAGMGWRRHSGQTALAACRARRRRYDTVPALCRARQGAGPPGDRGMPGQLEAPAGPLAGNRSAVRPGGTVAAFRLPRALDVT